MANKRKKGKFCRLLTFYLALACLILTASTRPQDCLRWNCPCAGATKREQRFPKRGFVSMTGEAKTRTQGLLRKMASFDTVTSEPIVGESHVTSPTLHNVDVFERHLIADRFNQNDHHVLALQRCVVQSDRGCSQRHAHEECSLHDLALVDQLNIRTINTEDDLMLLLQAAHRLLSTIAIYIEQARKDESQRLGDPKHSLEHDIKLIEELGIYNLLCKLQSTLYSHNVPLPEDLPKDIMHSECRSLQEMAKTDNRNFIVFLSLERVLDALLTQLERFDNNKE